MYLQSFKWHDTFNHSNGTIPSIIQMARYLQSFKWHDTFNHSNGTIPSIIQMARYLQSFKWHNTFNHSNGTIPSIIQMARYLQSFKWHDTFPSATWLYTYLLYSSNDVLPTHMTLYYADSHYMSWKSARFTS